MSDWGGERLREDKRWVFGVPPAGNANYAWIQHFIHHLAPGGSAGFVMSNGSLSSNTSGEGDIRKAIIEDDLVDCIIALPTQLFYTTAIPVTLWFLSRNKYSPNYDDLIARGTREGLYDRRGQTLFIDARKLGTLIDRRHRDFSDADIQKITGVYHTWCAAPYAADYGDIPGFCYSANLDEIRDQGYILTPGRYVGTEELFEGEEPFEESIERLKAKLLIEFEESKKLQEIIIQNIGKILQ